MLEHARSLGDSALVVALAAELADRALERRPGETGPDPQRQRAAEELALSCDRALAEMGDAELKKALALHDAAPTVEPVLNLALTAARDTPAGEVARARLVVAHATGDGGEPYQEHPKHQEQSRPVVGFGTVAPRPQPVGPGLRTSEGR